MPPVRSHVFAGGSLGSMYATPRIALALVVCALTTGARSAHAAEVITLHSGFTVECARREAVAGGITRLYLRGTDPSATNYIDIPSSSIAAIEAAPESPAPAVSAPSSALTATETRALETAVPLPRLLQHSGATHNVNVALLAAVIKAESAGNPRAVSRTGARGLMQLMPATAADLGVTDSFSPEANVEGGSAYLDGLLTRYHDNLVLAVAAYNAGPAAVDRYRGVPPYRETRLYVARVIREFNRLALQADPLQASR